MREIRGLGHGAAKWHTARVIARQRTSAEAQEGFRAFDEKRRPAWAPGRRLRPVRRHKLGWSLAPEYATIATLMGDELSPSQAAARIGATTRSVQRWIASGRLPARRVGGRWRVAIDAIDAFTASRRRRTPGDRAPAHPIGLHRQPRRDRAADRRTCERLGIRAIAPPTDGPDALDLLDIAAVVGAATAAEVDAVHPGFGFLAENADFAEAVAAAGLIWVGPPPAAIRAMGDKAAARRLAASLGVPVLAGLRRGRPGRCRPDGRRGTDRLPAPGQAGGRRWRQGHARRPRARSAAGCARRRAAGSDGGVR